MKDIFMDKYSIEENVINIILKYILDNETLMRKIIGN